MLSFALSVLFSKAGTLGGPVLLLIGAGVLAWFGLRAFAQIALVAALAWFGVGVVYREGYSAADIKWRAEAKAEIDRQVAEGIEVLRQADRQAAETVKEDARTAEQADAVERAAEAVSQPHIVDKGLHERLEAIR